jgi:hypothetical protein
MSPSELLKCIAALEAVVGIAGHNFPSGTDVEVRASGKASASVHVPSYQLSAILKAAREAISAEPQP